MGRVNLNKENRHYLVVEGGVDATEDLHPSAPVKVNFNGVHVLCKLVATGTKETEQILILKQHIQWLASTIPHLMAPL